MLLRTTSRTPVTYAFCRIPRADAHSMQALSLDTCNFSGAYSQPHIFLVVLPLPLLPHLGVAWHMVRVALRAPHADYMTCLRQPTRACALPRSSSLSLTRVRCYHHLPASALITQPAAYHTALSLGAPHSNPVTNYLPGYVTLLDYDYRHTPPAHWPRACLPVHSVQTLFVRREMF